MLILLLYDTLQTVATETTVLSEKNISVYDRSSTLLLSPLKLNRSIRSIPLSI